ncbi:MAG: RNA pyrophosphohydrolase [Alphaproteobacteria bacterium]|nr:RNA pyrophosphohydrolase [Alphaproteobacteria bacterium]
MTARDPAAYRPNVGLAMFHPSGLVFYGKRVATPGPYQWQMPQGGVDPGESPADAALRELEEEIGVPARLVDVLEETSDWLAYDFPPDQQSGRWRGQRQKWFALRFKGRDADVRLDLHTPEFETWRWGRLAEAPGLIIPFKRPVYEDVARRFARYAESDSPTR